MMLPVECPECGETVEGSEIETQRGSNDMDVTVARRQTAFDGSISSLLGMNHFAYAVEMPCCDETIITVN